MTSRKILEQKGFQVGETSLTSSGLSLESDDKFVVVQNDEEVYYEKIPPKKTRPYEASGAPQPPTPTYKILPDKMKAPPFFVDPRFDNETSLDALRSIYVDAGIIARKKKILSDAFTSEIQSLNLGEEGSVVFMSVHHNQGSAGAVFAGALLGGLVGAWIMDASRGFWLHIIIIADKKSGDVSWIDFDNKQMRMRLNDKKAFSAFNSMLKKIPALN